MAKWVFTIYSLFFHPLFHIIHRPRKGGFLPKYRRKRDVTVFRRLVSYKQLFTKDGVHLRCTSRIYPVFTGFFQKADKFVHKSVYNRE